MGSPCGGEENALRAAQVNRGAIAYGHLTRDRYRHHAGGYTLLTHTAYGTRRSGGIRKRCRSFQISHTSDVPDLRTTPGCQTPSKTPDTGHVAKSAHIYNDEY